jgi:hypothetical protein
MVLKNEIEPWRIKEWIIPPKQSEEFVYRMEQVLSAYERPYVPAFPVVYLDESPRRLLKVKQQ